MKLITAPTKSQQIADIIENEINAGILPRGSRLYSMRNLTEKFSVSIAVINSAYNILEEKKLIYRHGGKGTYVSKDAGKTQKVFGLITTWSQYHSEGYFESLFKVAEDNDCVVIPITVKPSSWQTGVKRLLTQNPTAVLVDLDAEHFSLKPVIESMENLPICFVNRWEWTEANQQYGVFTDYCGMITDALGRLRDKGHKRITFLGHKSEPLPFLKKELDICAKHFGLTCPSYEFEYLCFEDFRNNPDRIKRVYENADYPTAILARADSIIPNFVSQLRIKYPHIKELELVGGFNTSWSHMPGMEFDSYVIDFEKMWRLALNKFADDRPKIEKCMPYLDSVQNKKLEPLSLIF